MQETIFIWAFLGDLVSLGLAISGSILAVIVWLKLYNNKIFKNVKKVPIGIACGASGCLIGFISGILLESKIESLKSRRRVA